MTQYLYGCSYVVLQKIREQHPEVETLFFFSYGQTTKYWQKFNLYLFSTEIFELGFLKSYWNFHAVGHGKGIPDGIGAVLKRSADLRVKHGHDVTKASAFIQQVNPVKM